MIMDTEGLNWHLLRESRYDVVVHMVTAANGAEKAYTQLNNEARYEDAAQARAQDIRTETAYVGHPHHLIIGNKMTEGFTPKLERAMENVKKFIGIKYNSGFNKRFELAEGDITTIKTAVEKDGLANSSWTEEITVLSDTKEATEFLIRRSIVGNYTCYHVKRMKGTKDGKI